MSYRNQIYSRLASLPWNTILTVAVPVAVAAYGFLFRTIGIESHLWFLGDQARDWKIAGQPFTSLPLTGTPRSTGGYSFGPIYYWILWLIRHSLGPFFNHLPHAGVYGLAALHAVSDGILLFALAKRGIPLLFAAAISLILVSSPFEAALSATIWNPGLAVMFVNLTAAIFLLSKDQTLGRVVLITATAWLAVQAHTPAIFFTIPVIGFLIIDRARVWEVKKTLVLLALIIAVVGALQVPYTIFMFQNPDQIGGTTALTKGLEGFLSAPTSLNLSGSCSLLKSSFQLLVFDPLPIPGVAVFLILSSVFTCLVFVRSPELLIVSVVPTVFALIGYSFVTDLLEPYWLLSLTGSLGLTVFLGFTRPIPKRLSMPLSCVLVLAALGLQPGRYEAFNHQFKAPEYGILVKATANLAQGAGKLTGIHVPDDSFSRLSPEYLFELQGGQISEDAAFSAQIAANGLTMLHRSQK